MNELTPELTPELVAGDLAQVVNPGLRSARVALTVLPNLRMVHSERDTGTHSIADAIEAVINRALARMTADTPTDGRPRRADPAAALRTVLALRPGSDRVKSKVRRAAAAEAMGLLSGDGWRTHHEKPLLLALAEAICALEADTRAAQSPPSTSVSLTRSGIERFYADIVDIEHDWEDLFAASSTLDLAIMYGATWRNTYRKHLRAMIARPDGRLRVVLPNPAIDTLTRPYAHTLRISVEDFSHRVTEAINDFTALGPRRHVEVYLTDALFRHALYVFTHNGLLALYALCSERIPTPALLASEGELLSFMRTDFDRLLDHSQRVT